MDKKGPKHLEAGVHVLAPHACVAAAGHPASSHRGGCLLNVQGVLWRASLKKYYEPSAGWYKTTAHYLHREELGPASCGWKPCTVFLTF